MDTLSWDQFRKRIYLHAPMAVIYRSWATAEGIKSWFLREATYTRENTTVAPNALLQAGDRYTWEWHNWDGQESGTILEANGRDLLRFSFAGSCEVTVHLEAREEAVLLSLTQSKIPLDEKSKLEIFYGCSNGWTFWLANLKSYLEHGILLNETELDLRSFGLAGYEFVNM